MAERKRYAYGRIGSDYAEIRCVRLGLNSCSGSGIELDGKADKDTLVSAIKQADKECGSCGCELDPLYKRVMELL